MNSAGQRSGGQDRRMRRSFMKASSRQAISAACLISSSGPFSRRNENARSRNHEGAPNHDRTTLPRMATAPPLSRQLPPAARIPLLASKLRVIVRSFAEHYRTNETFWPLARKAPIGSSAPSGAFCCPRECRVRLRAHSPKLKARTRTPRQSSNPNTRVWTWPARALSK